MAEWNDLVNENLNQHWYKELPYKVAIKVISDAMYSLISSWVWILKSELREMQVADIGRFNLHWYVN